MNSRINNIHTLVDDVRINLGEIVTNDYVDAIGKAWDKITVCGKPIIGIFNYTGFWMFMAFKYIDIPYGMMIAIKFNSGNFILNVVNGTKTVKTIQIQ